MKFPVKAKSVKNFDYSDLLAKSEVLSDDFWIEQNKLRKCFMFKVDLRPF